MIFLQERVGFELNGEILSDLPSLLCPCLYLLLNPKDEFTVYEKSRWSGGAKRHIFLLDQRLIITKEKDIDGLYMYKDSLKVSYSMMSST